jgi:hypothetical protein
MITLTPIGGQNKIAKINNSVFNNIVKQPPQTTKNKTRISLEPLYRTISPNRGNSKSTERLHTTEDYITPKEYKDSIDNTMLYYHYERDKRQRSEGRTKGVKQDKPDIGYKHSISQDKRVGRGIDTLGFDNPNNSERVLQTNRQIRDLITNSNNERREILYDIALQERIRNYGSGVKMKNVKIRIPKNKNKDQEGDRRNKNKIKEEDDIIYQKIGYNNIERVMVKLGHYVYNKKLFPESREQFIWCYDGKDCVLFGGLVSNRRNDIWFYDIYTQLWTKQKQEEGKKVGYLRYGHTAILFKRKLIIFGGSAKQALVKKHSYVPEIEIYNLETNQWYLPNIEIFLPSARSRKNHVACLVGTEMFVHGGLSEEGEYLDDSYFLNLAGVMKWTKLNYQKQAPPRLAFHACCLVQSSEQLHVKLLVSKPSEQINTDYINTTIVYLYFI